ncbi:MAG: DUF3084 domain-containing protein [Vulcanimicrobiaceae bacterium]
MGTLGGLLLVVLIVAIAGLIAYMGDRVGHQVGRKRMTLFGLRPKYTSTIVAVGTGMMIALVVTVVTLLASQYARAAFFHLSEISNRVNALQAQADQLERDVKRNNVVVNLGDAVDDQYLVIMPEMTPAERRQDLAAYFDAVVATINRRYVPLGLRPYRARASDPQIAHKLAAVLADPKVVGGLLRGPVLLVAVADENLFVNDPIAFTLDSYPDQLIYRKGEAIASVQVDGGTAINPTSAYSELVGLVEEAAIGSGMPAVFSRAIATLSPPRVRAVSAAIRAGRGHFSIVARAAADIYPHTGGIPIVFDLSRKPK